MIHPLASVHPSARLGDGTAVWAGATVGAAVRTGPHCSIGACAEVGVSSSLGESVRIGHGAFLPARSRIGNRVFIGPGAIFADDRHPRVNHATYRAEPPTVEDDANIGGGAMVLPGVTIGRGATVGMGAVVTHDVESYAVVVGNPARALGRAEVR